VGSSRDDGAGFRMITVTQSAVTGSLGELGLVRICKGSRPVGAGFVLDEDHIVTCAHVINASLGRPLDMSERPSGIGPVEIRVGGQWIPVDVDLLPAGWIPPAANNRGDVAVLRFSQGRTEGAEAVPLRLPADEDRRFLVQGFPDQTLMGATGWIRARLTIGEEWLQLEDDKQPGRAVTEGFSGAPIWDTTANAVVGMAIARDARAPAAKIAAMLPTTRLAVYWPGLLDVLPSRLSLSRHFHTHWDPRSRGVEAAHVAGTYFTGRRRALETLVRWLASDPDPSDNLRLVTGGPGSGKSAVLAKLVTRAEPSYRRRYPPTVDDPVAALEPGAVNVAVYARGLGGGQILAALADGAEPVPTEVDELVAALAERGRPLTFVVDGLDESSEPAAVAGILRRLAGQTADLGLRLLVGTRPGAEQRLLRTLGTTAYRNAIDLDDSAYLERADLAEYVRRRLLLDGVPANVAPSTPYRGSEALAQRVADKVAERAHPSFLIAAMVAVDLVRRPTAVDPGTEAWEQFPATVDDAMRSYLERLPADDASRIEDLLRPLA
jgi:hypothetical protein